MCGSNAIYRSVLLILLLLSGFQVAAQKSKRGPYSLVAYVGGGASYYSGIAGAPSSINPHVTKIGPAGTVRVLWHPDHHLYIGLESGWTTLYSYRGEAGNDKVKMNLTGVPVLLVIAMPVGKRFLAFVGPGGYLLTSRLEYAGTVNSRKFSFGLMAAASYKIPLSERLTLSPEVKFFNARETKDATLSLQLMAVWKIHTW